MLCNHVIELKFYAQPLHKIGHFGDVLPSQSLGLVLKKLNPTQQKQTTREQNGKKHKNKPKSNLNLNQRSTLRIAHICAQLTYTIQHRTVLRIFSLILQTIIMMLPTEGEGKQKKTRMWDNAQRNGRPAEHSTPSVQRRKVWLMLTT